MSNSLHLTIDWEWNADGSGKLDIDVKSAIRLLPGGKRDEKTTRHSQDTPVSGKRKI